MCTGIISCLFLGLGKILLSYWKKMQRKTKSQKKNIPTTYQHKLLRLQNLRDIFVLCVDFHLNIAVQFVVLDFVHWCAKKLTKKHDAWNILLKLFAVFSSILLST